MPTKVRDNSPERRHEEKRHSRTEKDGTVKKVRRHKSTAHRSSSTKEKASSRTSLSSTDSKRRSSVPGADNDDDELGRSASRTSLPYPGFSKEHSKEAVGRSSSVTLHTPPATDVETDKVKTPQTRVTNEPPSPPLTDRNSGRPRTASSRGTPVDTIPEDEKDEKDGNERKEQKSTKITAVLRPKTSRSSNHLRSSSDAGVETSPGKTRDRASTPLKNVETAAKGVQRSASQPTRTKSPTPSIDTATEIGVNRSHSTATSVPTQQPRTQQQNVKGSSATVPKTQSSPTKPPMHQSESRNQPSVDAPSRSPAPYFPPPPPPPPPVIPSIVPKVDYLLQNGGLNQVVPKHLLSAGKPMAVQQAAANPAQIPIVVANLFEPYNSLLGDYEKVIAKNGSLAVATGYRSVARKLLDRLGSVFARDISSELCECPMCHKEDHMEDPQSVSWGEILELVAGRKELPSWPPFAFVATPGGVSLSTNIQTPMQEIDVDVPPQYREHYIRQSRKTKQSVDKWLSRQTEDSEGPPEEVDDETLTFAILTHLPAHQRQSFKDLLGIVDRPLGPPRRAPSPDKGAPKPPTTPQLRPRMQPVITAGQGIQRLYRLDIAPTDPETAFFLLSNTSMHDNLATIAAISDHEWHILISGRFDGFLRSGAEDFVPESSMMTGRFTPSRTSSRGPTPVFGSSHPRYPARQPTPTSNMAPQYGAPIPFDEEIEIAALTEIERDIYTGMEQLEDAFEALHQRAEAVRRTLRERSAGLAAAQQRRRGANASQIDIRLGTPASGVSGVGIDRWESETDDGLGDWDGVSEIAPDDSASNVSSARRRRPKRRNERRTPAMIDEEDEEDQDYADESERSRSPRKR